MSVYGQSIRYWLGEPMIHLMALARHNNKKQQRNEREQILAKRTAQIRSRQDQQIAAMLGGGGIERVG